MLCRQARWDTQWETGAQSQGTVWEMVEHTPGFPTKGSGGWVRHP